MSEENKAFIRRLVEEVQNGHNPDKLDELLAPTFVNHTTGGGAPATAEGAKQYHYMMFAAFPDLKVTIHSQAAEGDKVWTYKTFEATHQGEFMGIPASGKRISWDVIDIMIVSGGKITEHWAVADRSALMQQLS